MNYFNKRSMFVLLVIGICGAAIFSVVLNKKKTVNINKENNVVRIGYNIQSLNYSSVILAAEADLYKKNGLTVQLVPFSSGKDNRMALATGKTDVAFFNIVDAVILIDAGVPVKVVAPVNKVATTVFVRPDGKLQTLKDLKGKKIIAAAGASEYALRRAFDKEKLGDPNFEQVDVEKSFKEMALMTQKVVDVIPTSRSGSESYVKAGAVVLPEWKQKGYDDEFLPHMYMMVQAQFLKDRPDLIEKVVDTIIDAQKMMQSSETEAAQFVAKHMDKESNGAVKFTVEQIKESWHKDIKNVLWTNFDEVLGIQNFLYETKQIKNQLTLDKIIDFRFANKLGQAQKELYEAKE